MLRRARHCRTGCSDPPCRRNVAAMRMLVLGRDARGASQRCWTPPQSSIGLTGDAVGEDLSATTEMVGK